MKTPIFAGCAALLIAGCSEDAEEPLASTAVDGATLIDCSLNGAGGFGRDCTMERVSQDEGSYLIVRHPDGAFRRFELGVEGRGIITADGAAQADVTNMGGYVEVRVESDRYHLPIAE